MPRMVTQSEKKQCVKPQFCDTWEEEIKYQYLIQYCQEEKHGSYGIFEEMINALFPKKESSWFDEFVDIKEETWET